MIKNSFQAEMERNLNTFKRDQHDLVASFLQRSTPQFSRGGAEFTTYTSLLRLILSCLCRDRQAEYEPFSSTQSPGTFFPHVRAIALHMAQIEHPTMI